MFCSDLAVEEAVGHCTFLHLSQALGRREQNCLLCTELALAAHHQDGDCVGCSLVSSGHGQGRKIIFLVSNWSGVCWDFRLPSSESRHQQQTRLETRWSSTLMWWCKGSFLLREWLVFLVHVSVQAEHEIWFPLPKSDLRGTSAAPVYRL